VKHLTLAVLFECACRAAAGVVLAAPVTAVIAATGVGAFPEGDRLLFEPGGLLLVEIARLASPALSSLASSSLVTLVVLGSALTLPRALLWSASTEASTEPLGALFGRTIALVPSLLTLTGLGFLGQVLVCMLGLSAAGILRGASANPSGADLWALGAVLCAGFFALALGILRDLSSAAAACGAPNAQAALRVGLACVLRAPGAALARWLGPAAIGLALTALVAAAVGMLDVSRTGSLRLPAVAVLHQAVVVCLSCCRAAWFVAATRSVRPQLGAGSVMLR
jgi:hypothetical protein